MILCFEWVFFFFGVCILSPDTGSTLNNPCVDLLWEFDVCIGRSTVH